jgi:ABC-type thiamin/hydroxymethylpyrimidine transport system permease subunit
MHFHPTALPPERPTAQAWCFAFVQRDLLLPGPGAAALQPMAAGVIDFVCDNFCGSGHEEMHGRFVVRA